LRCPGLEYGILFHILSKTFLRLQFFYVKTHLCTSCTSNEMIVSDLTPQLIREEKLEHYEMF